MKNKKEMSPPLTQDELKKMLRNIRPEQIVSASTDEIAKAMKGVNRVLLAIGKQMSDNAEEWAASCFVTDESTVGDFPLEKNAIEAIGKELGCKITEDSYIKDIAIAI